MGVDYGVRRVSVALVGPSGTGGHTAALRWDRREYPTLSEVHRRAFDELSIRSMSWRPLAIAVEAPIVGMSKNAQTAVHMAMMAGAISAGVAPSTGRRGPVVEFVAPSSWKLAVVGHGNASKHDVADWLRATHQTIYAGLCDSRGKPDQDQVDAYCLALHACHKLGGAG